MKWFRLHWSLVDSITVGALSDSAFRTYIELQCLAGQCDDCGRTGVTPENINWRLRRNAADDVQTLMAAGLIALEMKRVTPALQGPTEIVIPMWSEIQSRDNSTPRVAKHRALKALKDKPETPCNGDETRFSNGEETLEERRGEENKDTVRKIARDTGFDTFWIKWPASKRKVGKAACKAKWISKGCADKAREIVAHVCAMVETQQWKDGFEPAPMTYLNQERWQDGLPPVVATADNPFPGAI